MRRARIALLLLSLLTTSGELLGSTAGTVSVTPSGSGDHLLKGGLRSSSYPKPGQPASTDYQSTVIDW